MEYKGKAGELQEEKNRWEAKREELMSQTPTGDDLSIVNIQKPLADFSADDLLVSMSQVSLKEEAIKELKTENEKMKAELTKVNENKKQIL